MTDTEKQPELPAGWCWAKLGETCKTTSGGTPSRKETSYYGGKIPWLKSGELNYKVITSAEESITEQGVQNSSAKIIPKGSLLIALYGATVGRLGILGIDSAINQAICAIFASPQIDQKYMFWYLYNYKKELLESRKGGAQPNISQQIIREINLPLPPFPEQHRIVQKIEELLTDLDSGAQALEKAKVQVKTYRQAILKAAVEGKLVPTEAELAIKENRDYESANKLLERILEEHHAKWKIEGEKAGSKKRYKEPNAPNIVSFQELPDGWCFATLEQLSWDAGYGTSVKCDYGFSGTPILRIPNIKNGLIDLKDLKFSTDSELNCFEHLEYGDFLVIRTNGSRDLIGRAALVPENFDNPHYFASYLIRFRIFVLDTLPNWLNSIWDAPAIRLWIEHEAATTAGQYNISMGKLNKLVLPLPPLAEQHRIVSEIERRFSVIDQIEKIIDQSLAQAEKLRQSILKKAFEGKLVPQDPEDEPASVLLEKIRQEKAELEARKKLSKTKAKAKAKPRNTKKAKQTKQTELV